MSKNAVRAIPIAKIDPDPEQPRRTFPPDQIEDLAASIEQRGLLQPIVVEPVGDRYRIVLGECRWRAHKLLVSQGKVKFSKIKALLGRPQDRVSTSIDQLVENTHRNDMNAIEEVEHCRRIMEQTGWTIEELCAALGWKTPSAVARRMRLLDLRPEYQALVKSGQLKNSVAVAMAELALPAQDELFARVRRGECETFQKLRWTAEAIRERYAQVEMFTPEEAPPVDPGEREALSRVERSLEQLFELAATGFEKGELVIARKLDPTKAAAWADKIELMRAHLLTVEKELRQAAVVAQPLPLGEAA